MAELPEKNQGFSVGPHLLRPGLGRQGTVNCSVGVCRVLQVPMQGAPAEAQPPSPHPQYRILLHGCWYELFGGNPDNFPTELDGDSQGELTQPLLGEQSLLTHWSPAYSSSSDSPLDSSPKYPPLYPPGRIIHLEEEGGSGR